MAMQAAIVVNILLATAWELVSISYLLGVGAGVCCFNKIVFSSLHIYLLIVRCN